MRELTASILTTDSDTTSELNPPLPNTQAPQEPLPNSSAQVTTTAAGRRRKGKGDEIMVANDTLGPR